MACADSNNVLFLQGNLIYVYTERKCTVYTKLFVGSSNNGKCAEQREWKWSEYECSFGLADCRGCTNLLKRTTLWDKQLAFSCIAFQRIHENRTHRCKALSLLCKPKGGFYHFYSDLERTSSQVHTTLIGEIWKKFDLWWLSIPVFTQ